jgi:hypothetical protein
LAYVPRLSLKESLNLQGLREVEPFLLHLLDDGIQLDMVDLVVMDLVTGDCHHLQQ